MLIDTYIFTDCTVDINADHADNFIGLFFQDTRMKKDFASYPEILFVDATYKLMEIRLPVYVFMVEDSMGLSEVVAVALLVNETRETVSWLVNRFKSNNNTSGLRVVMADKDMNERSIIKELFGVPVLICLFHSLKAFKRQLAGLKLTNEQAELAKEYFQKMCYSSSFDEFQNNVKLFKDSAPSKLLDYFEKQWEPISKDWVRCLKSKYGNFLNSTNNRLESFNGKLKSVISHHSSLEVFVEGFFVVLSTLRNERDHVIVTEFQKVKISHHKESDVESQIQGYLTSYAADYVVAQLKKAQDTKKNIGDEEFHSTNDSCTCCFSVSMRLPCRHIFSRRLFSKLPVFCESLCDTRWSKNYCKATQRVFEPCQSSLQKKSVHLSTTPKRKQKTLSQNERFREINRITTRIASIASEVGGGLYQQRLELLELLCASWEKNAEVNLLQLNNGMYLVLLTPFIIGAYLLHPSPIISPNIF